MQNFYSELSINDYVVAEIAPGQFVNGTIESVVFSESKVKYNIRTHFMIMEGIDSALVHKSEEGETLGKTN
jgi:hypothetical protein